MTLSRETRRVIAEIKSQRTPQTRTQSAAHVVPESTTPSLPTAAVGVSVNHRTITVDGHALRMRIHRPESGALLPGLIYLHGGGWTSGNLDSHAQLSKILSAGLHAAIVSIDYRLAPAHPFPTAVDDAEAALEWLHTHAGDLGIDPELIGVVGDSAGGNIAAGLTHRLCAAAAPRCPVPGFQALLYPVLDAPSKLSSYTDPDCHLYLTPREMHSAWLDYAPTSSASTLPIDLAPLRDSNLTALPPTYILTAECDPLRDEGRRYAYRLQGTDVDYIHDDIEGVFHGFLRFTDRFDKGAPALEQTLGSMRILIDRAREPGR